MYRIFKNSMDDFRASYPLYLSFEIIYSLIASIVFTPFLTYVFNKLLMLTSGGVLLNQDVFQLGVSFNGLMSLFVISFLSVAILFVEFGTLIIIAEKRYFKTTVFVTDAFLNSISQLPKLLGLGVFQLFFLLLLVIPFLDATTLPPLLDLNITILLTDMFDGSFIAASVYVIVLAAIIYLYIRWLFVLHFIFIDNQTIWRALGSSWRLTKHRKIRLVVSLVLWNLLIVGAGFLIVTLMSWISSVLDSKIIGDFIGNYLSTISGYMTLILSLFFIPVNVIILTRLFHRSLLKAGDVRSDELNLVRAPALNRMESKLINLLKRKRNIIIPVIALIVTLGFTVNHVINDSIVYLPWDVKVAGHKGDGFSAPENSIASVQSGIKKGVNAVEVDVTLTKDDVLVLSHDQNLKRIAGVEKLIRNMTYDEISEIDIGRQFDEAFKGESIPKLDDVLDVITEAKTDIIIDVKADLNESVYAEEIARLIDKHDAENYALVQSFNTGFLKKIRKENKDVDIGQILYLSAGNLSGMDVDFYTVRESMLTKRFIQQAKQNNRDVWVWTVNSRRNIKEVLTYDIDGIITDYPLRVQQLLDIELAEGRPEDTN